MCRRRKAETDKNARPIVPSRRLLKRTAIILNPSAGSAEQAAALLEAIRSHPELTLFETREPGDARALAARAVDEGFARVVAAGGDGTSNEVVNGLASVRHGLGRATFGVIPLGTGNDLPRTLGIPLDPVEALDVLLDPRLGQERVIDLVRVKMNDKAGFYVNVAAGGFSGQVDEALTDEMKAAWGPLAYLRGAISVLPDLTRYHTRIRLDGKAWSEVKALNIIVANARTAAGGMPVAPHASPEDGRLDVVVVHPGSVLQMTGVAARLVSGGDYVDSQIVSERRARRVEIRSSPGMWFNVDGELIGNGPVVFSIRPGALRAVVGNAELGMRNAE